MYVHGPSSKVRARVPGTVHEEMIWPYGTEPSCGRGRAARSSSDGISPRMASSVKGTSVADPSMMASSLLDAAKMSSSELTSS